MKKQQLFHTVFLLFHRGWKAFRASSCKRKASKGFSLDCAKLLFCALIRGLQNLRASLKGFNCCGAKLRLRCAGSRFAEPQCFLKKVLIVAVRSCGCSVLIRGLQNLGASCEGKRVVTFCIVQKVTKKHARTCKKLPVASFCASETAETGRIANGRKQGDHVSRRRRSPATHDSKLCRK